MKTNGYSGLIQSLSETVAKAGIELHRPRKPGRTPTQAFSEFLTNREQGDWAERVVLDALRTCGEDPVPVKYGRTDDIVAGDEKFATFYKRYQDELDTIGKRPDILLVPKIAYGQDWQFDASHLTDHELANLGQKALAGFEVRSSAFLSRKYAEYMSRHGKVGRRTFLSFTVKVEDLMVVLKWISLHHIPYYYIQVFFDAAYAIGFHKVLEILGDRDARGVEYTVERNQKNQQKTTIHLNLAEGIHLGDVTAPPRLEAVRRELERGRLLFHVRFEGGAIAFDCERLHGLLEEARMLRDDAGKSLSGSASKPDLRFESRAKRAS